MTGMSCSDNDSYIVFNWELSLLPAGGRLFLVLIESMTFRLGKGNIGFCFSPEARASSVFYINRKLRMTYEQYS
ncbi:MAG: hypothetical protein K0R55_2920 [Sporomusa sp.]|jgi:hypothetical protein|nr:hypothetical protein [Sporomusa sp.]